MSWFLCSKCTRALNFVIGNVQEKSACAKRFASASLAQILKSILDSGFYVVNVLQSTLFSGVRSKCTQKYSLYSGAYVVNVLKSTLYCESTLYSGVYVVNVLGH